MKNTLLLGDYIVGIKCAYKIKTPNYIPFTHFKIPSIEIFDLSKPERNDIVVFNLDEFLVNPRYSNKDFIKRIVGKPGEIIELKKNKLFVNNREVSNHFIFDDKTSFSEKIEIYDYSKEGFSYLNYGPIKIPQKGDTININPNNIKFWQPLINYENQGKFISVEGTVITFKGIPIKEYVIKENYYFVLGDNIVQSFDSRIFGFVPENLIESKVVMIYLSLIPQDEKPSSNFWERIRFERLFTMPK
jgi:signal peptidase I